MNLLTVIVLIIYALCMLRGYRKGFAKSLISMISLIVSLILVIFISPYVTTFIKNETPLYGIVQEKCKEAFVAKNEQEETVKEEEDQTTEEQSEEEQNTSIEGMLVPEVLKSILLKNNTPETYKELAVNTVEEYVSEFMAELSIKIISFIVTWIMVLFVLSVVGILLNMLVSLPLIHGVNQLLGLGFGCVQATLIVWIGMLVITVASNSQAGKQLMEMISNSQFLKILYKSNLILDLLQNTVLKIF